MIIDEIVARKVFDGKGNPTVEVEIYTDCGSCGSAIAPTGTSTGTYEAVAIPVEDSLERIRSAIADRIIGESADHQEEIDSLLREIDGSDNFSNIGGNTAVALSMAIAKAAAAASGMPLYRYLGGVFGATPRPLGNVLGGGAHARGATDIQEFLAVPVGAPTIMQAVYANTLVHKQVKKLLTAEGVTCQKGDEGGWAPAINDGLAFDVLDRAVKATADEVGFEVRYGIDVAATDMWHSDQYVYRDARLTPEEQVDYVAGLIDEHHLYYVEDPLQEGDFEGFARLTARVGDRCLICGDDLFCTNVSRIRRGIRKASTNAVLIKPNQIGTVTDTYRAIALAKKAGYATVMSHRSGDSTDSTIAHLAVAFGCELIKTGVAGGERIAKLNELIRIGDAIGQENIADARRPEEAEPGETG